jgi:hypothetical protein
VHHLVLSATPESATKKESVLVFGRVSRVDYPTLSTEFYKNRDIAATVRCKNATH